MLLIFNTTCGVLGSVSSMGRCGVIVLVKVEEEEKDGKYASSCGSLFTMYL